MEAWFWYVLVFVFVCRSSLPASKLIGEISVAPQGFVTELASARELPGLFASIRNAMIAVPIKFPKQQQPLTV